MHEAITNDNYHMGIGTSLLRQIHKEMNKLVEFCIKHVFQEVDIYVDDLEKL